MSKTPKIKTEKGGVVSPVSSNAESVKEDTGIVNEGSGGGNPGAANAESVKEDTGNSVSANQNAGENSANKDAGSGGGGGGPILKMVFGEGGNRVAGLAGIGSSGKTNSIMYLLKNFHDLCPSVQIYTYGLTERTQEWATKNLKAIEVSCISHLSDKSNSIFFLDEVHLLGLSDRTKVSEVKAFASFLNHSNNYVILSTSNIKEYNSTLCSIINVWLLKTVKINMTTNGTDLKRSIRDYRGRYKRLDDVILPVNKLLVLSDQRELVIDIEYIPEIDGKAELPDLFAC